MIRNQNIFIVILAGITALYLVFSTFTKPVQFQQQSNITKELCEPGYVKDSGDKGPSLRTDAYYNLRTEQSFGPDCSRPIPLKPFGPEHVKDDQMFFLETSGKSRLSPRQSCSIESAAKFSNMHVRVILLNNTLDLTDNSTCYLYKTVPNVEFYTVDLSTIFEDTPLLSLIQSKAFKESCCKIEHQSDALRLALVFKYGGWYSDLDAVTIRDLSKFKNVIGVQRISGNAEDLPQLANGEFQFEKKHPVLWEAMTSGAKSFTGTNRVEIGPPLLTQAVATLYDNWDMKSVKNENILILPLNTFYPVEWFNTGALWPSYPMGCSDWSRLFENSSQVHFFGSQTDNAIVDHDPSHQAYAALGPKYCPVSIWSSETF